MKATDLISFSFAHEAENNRLLPRRNALLSVAVDLKVLTY